MHNPYRVENENVLTATSTLFAGYTLPERQKRVNERGELLKYFSQKLKQPIPRFVAKLTGLQVPDLYYIKSAADSYEKQGHPWSKAFHGMLKPKA
jgi:hypothetical protein